MLERNRVRKSVMSEILDRYGSEAKSFLSEVQTEDLSEEQQFSLVNCIVKNYIQSKKQIRMFAEVLGEILSFPKEVPSRNHRRYWENEEDVYRRMQDPNHQEEVEELADAFVDLHKASLFNEENFQRILKHQKRLEIASQLYFVLSSLRRSDLLIQANISRLLSTGNECLFTPEYSYVWSRIPNDLITQHVLDEIFIRAKRKNPQQEIQTYLDSIVDYAQKRQAIISVSEASEKNCSHKWELSSAQKADFVRDYLKGNIKVDPQDFLNNVSANEISLGIENYVICKAESLRKEKGRCLDSFEGDSSLDKLKEIIKERLEKSGKQGIELQEGFDAGMKTVKFLDKNLIAFANRTKSALEIGSEYSKAGDFHNAFRFFSLIPHDENYSQAMVELGRIELEKETDAGDAAAAEYFERAGDAMAFEIGCIYRSYDNKDRRKIALLYFSEVPPDHVNYTEAMDECGSIQLTFGNSELAEKYFGRANIKVGSDFLSDRSRMSMQSKAEPPVSSGNPSSYGSEGKHSPGMYRPAGSGGSPANNNNSNNHPSPSLGNVANSTRR